MEEELEIPFDIVDEAPIFPGCERVAMSERRKCFQEEINAHIRRNFRYPEIAQEMGPPKAIAKVDLKDYKGAINDYSKGKLVSTGVKIGY